MRVVLAAAVVAGVARLAIDPVTTSARRTVEPVLNRIHATASRPLALPGEGSGEVRSLLNVRERMRYGQYLWSDRGIPPGPVWVRVDRRAQTLSVFRSGHEIGTAIILYGAPDKPTPAGRFPVLEKRREHRSTLYDADMPYMLRLTGDGIAVHGSAVREGRATNGCIGLPDAFAARLFELVKVGDPVVIV